MTKITLGLGAAALFSLVALSAPASAFPASQLGASNSSTNVIDVQYRRNRQHCSFRKVVTYKHGHRVVRQVRTCR